MSLPKERAAYVAWLTGLAFLAACTGGVSGFADDGGLGVGSGSEGSEGPEGSGGASVARAPNGHVLGPNCSSLSTCCTNGVPPRDVPTCQSVLMGSDETACANALDGFATDGICAGPGFQAASGSGSGPGGPAGGGVSCANLADCCGQLSPPDTTQCAGVVAAGDATACNDDLVGYESTGLCSVGMGSASGAACNILSTTCPGLTPTAQPGCDAVVVNADDTACAATLVSVLHTQGMCGSTNPDACAPLATCCPNLDSLGPIQATCHQVVAQKDPCACDYIMNDWLTWDCPPPNDNGG